ncbi:unnamed protein product [Adineta ricciae]|uniref:Uncharacterized protein n=1 Tax=Adineta ricciae TaxID=249248 RepID=A0A816GLC8_ADIRI|nr:unnamed protein product [Adineta ricciae]CAF1675533.1 unnamed protein product [Adineta ricciae]
MDRTAILREYDNIPTTFLFNKFAYDIMSIICAVIRCYRYNVTMNDVHYISFATPQYRTRQSISFTNLSNQHLLTIQQRETISLTKLIYFYLDDQRHRSAMDFTIIYPSE